MGDIKKTNKTKVGLIYVADTKMFCCFLSGDGTIRHCAETQTGADLELQPLCESTGAGTPRPSEPGPGHKGKPLKASAGFHEVKSSKAIRR